MRFAWVLAVLAACDDGNDLESGTDTGACSDDLIATWPVRDGAVFEFYVCGREGGGEASCTLVEPRVDEGVATANCPDGPGEDESWRVDWIAPKP